MILKIRLLAGVFLLMVMFSAIACADNLLIGGILQEAMNNPKYQEIAVSLNAEYIPTYYGGFKSDVTEVRKAALGIASVQNGLLGLDGQPNQALNHHYETIVAYSGGSSTAVTALADYSKYKLTCDTLILVSPMAAAVSDATIDKTVLGKKIVPHGATLGGMVGQIMDAANSGDTEANTKFEEQILTILKNNPNLKIIVIQSPQDKPTPKSETYQYSFTKDGNAFKEFENRITIHNQELDSRGLLDKGINAHNDLFFDFAKTHLANTGSRIEFSPTSQSSEESAPGLQEKKPITADVASLGMIGEQQQSKKATTFKAPYVAKPETVKLSVDDYYDLPAVKESEELDSVYRQLVDDLNYASKSYTDSVPVTSSTTESSENSVIGTWNVVHNTPTPAGAISFTVTFYSDGTFNQPGVHGTTQGGTFSQEPCSGSWTQNGNSVSWGCSWGTFEGTTQGNSMSGMSSGAPWSAVRAGTATSNSGSKTYEGTNADPGYVPQQTSGGWLDAPGF